MRAYVVLKWPILLGCLGAALLLSPACKAQSEIAPDHFAEPNTEPFEKANTFSATKADEAKDKAVVKQKAVATKEQPRKSYPNQSVQLAAARDLSQPKEKDAVAIENDRKPAARIQKEH